MVILAVFQHPESPIVYEQRDTRAILDNRDLGIGTLYVSERTLCWKEQEGLGFCIEYPHISMHAITTDPNVYHTECVYIMIDGHITIPGANGGPPPSPPPAPVNPNHHEDEDEDDTESEVNISQLLIVPSEATAVRSIYSALSQCQVLNPDPEDMIEEEENVYEDAEDYNEEGFGTNGRMNDLGAGGDSDVNHLSAQLRNHSLQQANYTYGNGDQNFDDDQFEDAD